MPLRFEKRDIDCYLPLKVLERSAFTMNTIVIAFSSLPCDGRCHQQWTVTKRLSYNRWCSSTAMQRHHLWPWDNEIQESLDAVWFKPNSCALQWEQDILRSFSGSHRWSVEEWSASFSHTFVATVGVKMKNKMVRSFFRNQFLLSRVKHKRCSKLWKCQFLKHTALIYLHLDNNYRSTELADVAVNKYSNSGES